MKRSQIRDKAQRVVHGGRATGPHRRTIATWYFRFRTTQKRFQACGVHITKGTYLIAERADMAWGMGPVKELPSRLKYLMCGNMGGGCSNGNARHNDQACLYPTPLLFVYLSLTGPNSAPTRLPCTPALPSLPLCNLIMHIVLP